MAKDLALLRLVRQSKWILASVLLLRQTLNREDETADQESRRKRNMAKYSGNWRKGQLASPQKEDVAEKRAAVVVPG